MKTNSKGAQRAISPRDREALLRSLRSGVTPSVGLQHIQVGRHEETASFLRDIDAVAAGGASFRLLIGEYGSGKTFFLSLARSLAMERGLVTMHADLSPTKRLHGANGAARFLLAELLASTSTRTKRDGNALPLLLERLKARAEDSGVTLTRHLEPLAELPGGTSMAKVIREYAEGREWLRADALRWLQADYTSRTEAMRDLGVRDIPGRDGDLLSSLRLYAMLAQLAGYKGLFICLDEMVNLYKIVNAVSRKANYEEILSMINNTMQGNVSGLGIVMAGTPEFLTDPRRGLYSYEALRSRLAENTLTGASGLKDYDSTVLRLANLTREELFVLLKNIRRIYASENPEMEQRLPDEALLAFLEYCFGKVGESYFRTPRNTIKAFIDLASLLRQYPDKTWQEILPGIGIDVDIETNPSVGTSVDIDDDLADFRL